MVPDIKTANIYQITKADLIDNTRLGDLYVHAVREGLWSNGNRFMLEFVALAEKALADDKNGTPGVLFASLLRREGVGRYVTNACEARALLRFSSESRERWVSAAALQPPPVSQPELFDLDSLDNLGFCHSILMQCFLPQGRKPGLTYTQQHGKVSLMIEAGWCIDPKRPGRFMRSRIPHGSRARLIMHYVMTEAVRTQSSLVDMGRSLRNFLLRIGVPIGGTNAQVVSNMVYAVGTATITLGGWEEDRAEIRSARVANIIRFWCERDADQTVFWHPEMGLSPDFFDALMERPVPVNSAHLASLGRSARCIDLYSWLTYRTVAIPRRKKADIRLDRLQPIFAPDIDPRNRRYFRAAIKRDLAKICALHPFRVEVAGDVLRLRRSQPPIRHKTSVLLGSSIRQK